MAMQAHDQGRVKTALATELGSTAVRRRRQFTEAVFRPGDGWPSWRGSLWMIYDDTAGGLPHLEWCNTTPPVVYDHHSVDGELEVAGGRWSVCWDGRRFLPRA